MGCIVNGPGESKHADIGISLPGTGEAPAAPVFIDGEKALTLRGENIAAEFHQLVENYIEKRFGAHGRSAGLICQSARATCPRAFRSAWPTNSMPSKA